MDTTLPDMLLAAVEIYGRLIMLKQRYSSDYKPQKSVLTERGTVSPDGDCLPLTEDEPWRNTLTGHYKK